MKKQIIATCKGLANGAQNLWEFELSEYISIGKGLSTNNLLIFKDDCTFTAGVQYACLFKRGKLVEMTLLA